MGALLVLAGFAGIIGALFTVSTVAGAIAGGVFLILLGGAVNAAET